MRDVGRARARLAAFAPHHLRGLLGGRAVAIDAKHLRTLAGKGDRGGLAVAPTRPDRAGTHHHRNLALEPTHRVSPLLLFFADDHLCDVSTNGMTGNLGQRPALAVMA